MEETVRNRPVYSARCSVRLLRMLPFFSCRFGFLAVSVMHKLWDHLILLSLLKSGSFFLSTPYYLFIDLLGFISTWCFSCPLHCLYTWNHLASRTDWILSEWLVHALRTSHQLCGRVCLSGEGDIWARLWGLYFIMLLLIAYLKIICVISILESIFCVNTVQTWSLYYCAK